MYILFIPLLHSLFFYLCDSVAKQRIDIGYFLFEAEMKTKKEKKQIKRLKAKKILWFRLTRISIKFGQKTTFFQVFVFFENRFLFACISYTKNICVQSYRTRAVYWHNRTRDE